MNTTTPPVAPRTIDLLTVAHPLTLIPAPQRAVVDGLAHSMRTAVIVLLAVGGYNALPEMAVHADARQLINRRGFLLVNNRTGEVRLTAAAEQWLRDMLRPRVAVVRLTPADQ